MSDDRRSAPLIAPPPVVALAGWLLPGLGYWLIGQRVRGVTIGLTIIVMYVSGLLIAGVRVIDVPTYNEKGQKLHNASLTNEIRAKPWSIAQVMAGPMAVASGAASIWAGEPDETTGQPRGVRTHVRIPEIATLYTAVAGMLNLLAIIDAASRAGREAK